MPTTAPRTASSDDRELLAFSPLRHVEQAHELVHVIQSLSLARSLAEIQQIIRTSARRLTGADGATFVLREEDQCYYADEDAISPL